MDDHAHARAGVTRARTRMRPWLSLSAESRATFWRSLQTFTVTRIVITVVLLLYLSFDAGRGHAITVPFTGTCVAYLAAALLFASVAYGWRHRFLLQLAVQVLT